VRGGKKGLWCPWGETPGAKTGNLGERAKSLGHKNRRGEVEEGHQTNDQKEQCIGKIFVKRKRDQLKFK